MEADLINPGSRQRQGHQRVGGPRQMTAVHGQGNDLPMVLQKSVGLSFL